MEIQQSMGEKTTLEWTRNFILSWSDFQAESNPAVFEDSHNVIKYRFTWVVDSEKIDEDIVFLINDISLFVEFHPLLSWVRQSEANESLLNHEQGNFDLAELVKRENIKNLQEQFYKKHFSTRGQNDDQRKQFAKEDSGKMINEQVKKLQNLFVERSQKYQNETKYGQNIDEQTKYDLAFKQLRT